MEKFSKIIHPADEGQWPIFCKIEYREGRLSITGVVGPMRNGDAHGSCGQCTDSVRQGKPAANWTDELLARFVEVWERWHLNDMRAGCEHQRAIDVSRKVEVVSYKLTSAALALRKKTLKDASAAALRGEEFNPSPTARALAEMEDWYQDRFGPPDADSPLSGCYEVGKREQKAIGWTRPAEHQEGMLCRACQVCGYKYGSAWLREDVPQEVLEFLTSLPETDRTPAWI